MVSYERLNKGLLFVFRCIKYELRYMTTSNKVPRVPRHNYSVGLYLFCFDKLLDR